MVSNYKIVCQSCEIEYAYTLGYEIYLIKAVISYNKLPLFKNYIEELYAERVEYKKLMGLAKK